MSDYPVVNSHNSWSKLEEVWLGDVYPDSWYSHLPNDVEDTFCKINEITRTDLAVINAKLKEFGVIVRRPEYRQIDDHIKLHNDQLAKPEITPRDYTVVIGDTLVSNHHARINDPKNAWRSALADYGSSAVHAREIAPDLHVDGTTMPAIAQLNGANLMRYGNRLLWDTVWNRPGKYQQQLVEIYNERFPGYTWQLVDNGGHVDGCFCMVRPGLLLTTRYFDDYETYFPGWDTIAISEPEFVKQTFLEHRPAEFTHNGQWWIEDVQFSKSFNDHVINYAQDWVGCPQETFFEVNALSLDENNIVVLGENDAVARKLEEYGVTMHSIPFRARTFWDGGMHCLTVDIRRQSKIEDVFSIDTTQYLK